MESITNLADEIEYRWRAAGYSEAVFSEIAAEALTAANLHELITPWQLLETLGTFGEFPEQRDLPAGFSNLPLTLANRPRFYVDLYLWLDGTTTIHQHSFSGAFQVLEGSSLHSRYRFDEQRRINEHFRVGEVVFESAELLRQGEVRQIIPGINFAHSLFHLARPSATITVRTFQDVTQFPQLSYLKPSLAINPFFSDQLMTKRVQTVALMLATQHPEADQVIRECFRTADAHTTFLLLSEVNQWSRRPSFQQMFEPDAIKQRFDELVEYARSIHGKLVDEFTQAFAMQNWDAEIIKRRGKVNLGDHRFFLALLLNLPNRREIGKMVAAYAPAIDPNEQMLEWIERLGLTRDRKAEEANALGLTEWHEGSLFLLEFLLAGKSAAEIVTAIEEELPSLAVIREETAETWVNRTIADLRGSSLRPLLID